MTIKTSKWEPAEYLGSPKAIAAYLKAAFEDGDPALIATALGVRRRLYLTISPAILIAYAHG